MKHGATVRILSPISPENSSVAHQLSQITELKRLDKPFKGSFASIDTRELVIMENKPDDLRTDRGSDTAIWTTNRLLIGMYDQLFDRFWNVLPALRLKK